MILQRLTQAFRKQDWFTVVIEIMIVVLGVFIGLQVNNWNNERTARAADHQYIERLHAETMELYAVRQAQVSSWQNNVPALMSAMEVLFSEEAPLELTVHECTALSIMHLFASPPRNLPTVTELYSSGRFDSLRSPEVREAIRQFTKSMDAGDAFLSSLMIDPLSLSQKYPHYIHMNFLVRDDFGIAGQKTMTAVYCDVAGMRADHGFLNDVADNAERYFFYLARVLEGPQAPMLELHRVLDEELGIVHEATAP